jgi:hypothetical protein
MGLIPFAMDDSESAGDETLKGDAAFCLAIRPDV